MRTFICAALSTLVLMACKEQTNPQASMSTPAATAEPSVPRPGYRLALDSQSPGATWRKSASDELPPSDRQDVRSLAYFNSDLRVANIIAIHMYWETDEPERFAMAEVKRWKSVYPDAVISAIEASAVSGYATFFFIHRSAHSAIRVTRYAFVRLPGAKGLVRLEAECDVEDDDVVKEAFHTVLGSLTVKTL